MYKDLAKASRGRGASAGIIDTNSQYWGKRKLVDTKKWSTGYLNPKGLEMHESLSPLDETELRDTIFHEGKHYFIDRFGQAVPITKGLQYEGLGGIRRRGPAGMFGSPTIPDDKREGQHGTIYFADIFRNSPFLNMILELRLLSSDLQIFLYLST